MLRLVKNVKIIGPKTLIEDQDLLLRGSLIEALVAKDSSPFYDEEIDGQGLYLAPGFIDIHHHGSSGFDAMDASREALEALGKHQLSRGVTSYLASLITSSREEFFAAIDAVKDYGLDNELLGLHLEGPFFSAAKRGAQPLEHLREVDLDFIEELVDRAGASLKMVSLAPELAGALELIDYLVARDILVAMGHSQASYERSLEAIDRGASLATHLYNAMGPFGHREPGLVGASLTDDRVYCELIYDRLHVHDGAIKLALRAKAKDKIILVSDAMMAAGLEDGDYWLGGQEVFVRDREPRLKDGTLAGSILDLSQAVYNLINYQGVSLVDAVAMASLNPAQALGLRDRGSIEAGKRADFILIDENISIKETYRAARLVYKNEGDEK